MTTLDSVRRSGDTGSGNVRREVSTRLSRAGDALNPPTAYPEPDSPYVELDPYHEPPLGKRWIDIARLWLPLRVQTVAGIIDLLTEDFTARELVARPTIDNDVIEVGYYIEALS